MANQRRTKFQSGIRRATRASSDVARSSRASRGDGFKRCLITVLVIHLIVLALIFINLQSSGVTTGTPPVIIEKVPPEPEEQIRYFELAADAARQLPTLPESRNTGTSSEVVLPTDQQVEQLARIEQEKLERERQAEEAMEKIRREREAAEREVAERKVREKRERIAAEKRRELEKKKARDRKLAADRKRKQEADRVAKAKADAARKKRAADAAAAKKAAADAEAKRIANAKRNGSSSGSGGTSGSGNGRLPAPDMAWYNNEVLGPAFYSAWSQPSGPAFTGKRFSVTAKIVVRKDGRVISAEITRPSGNATVDDSVRAALRKVGSLAPLPRGFRGSSYTESLTFALDS